MIRVTDVKNGYLDLDGARRVDQDVYEEFSKRHKPTICDLVLSRVGSYGVPAIVESNEPFCLGQNTVFIVPNVNPYWLYYYLLSPNAKSQIDRLVAGTTQPTISLKSIKQILVHIPPTEIQKSIVSKFKDISSKVKELEINYKNRAAAISELKQSILQKAFAGELTKDATQEKAVA